MTINRRSLVVLALTALINNIALLFLLTSSAQSTGNNYDGASSPPASSSASAAELPSASLNSMSSDSIESWTSPHLVDCKHLGTNDLDKQPAGSDPGIFKLTSTNPSFQMNIYDPTKDGVSKVISDEGCWECDHLTNMLQALSNYPNSYFLDIGTNIGMWSLTAAAAGYQTFSIEALSDNCERFCKSVDKNDFYNRTHLMNVAATSQPETFRLDVPRGNVGGTRVIAVGNDASGSNNKIVKGVTIDSLNLPRDRPIVMKLDVEGHELQALLGKMDFIQNANIVYAMMELRPNLHNDVRWKTIFDIFSSKGLKPFRINYEDETPLSAERLHEWKHHKHPMVKYYDVAWRLDDWNTTHL